MLVGLDEQLMRGQPRAEILVKRATQLRIERDVGGELILDLPGDEVAGDEVAGDEVAGDAAAVYQPGLDERNGRPPRDAGPA